MKVHIQSEKSFHKGLSFFRNIFIGMMLCLFMCNQDTHAMPLTSKAKINSEIQKKYESLENKKPAELERLAYRYLKSQKLDSALVCFSIIAGSYEESMSRADKARCANAYYRCGSIYINRYKVYSIALQNMQTALDIATGINDRDIQSGILIYIGNIYVFYADLHKSDEMMAKGFEMYRRAMHIASEQQQWNNLLMAFGNIASCTPKYASKMNILQDVEYFKTIHIPDGTPLITPFRAIANGVTLKDRHQYDEAIVQFEQASEAFTDMKDEGVMLRYQFGPACHISECYLMLGEPGNALSMMHAMEKKALELQLKDLIPEIYTRLEDIYHQQGNSLMEQKYRLMCLEEKDSLMHAERLEGVKDTYFLHELGKLADQLKESSYHRERQRLLLAGGTILLLGVFFFLLVVYRKNRQLDARNKALYDRMQDLLHESTHIQEVKEKENAPKKQQKKSSSDNLSDEQKTELIEKLRLLLTDTDVLCASDLSEQNLAQQIGTNISYLSRAINDVYNCNFNNLVNNLRVQEACRRIDDKDNFGQFSMEGIGQSVGFNSRSTFNAAFKRVTGLTPSEYQREARKND